ncbi:MAG: FAD-binding protein [Sphingomonadales bacterium]|nr:FAD-binding protein [Sphingomonadales bacterium]MBU3990989.1 FAD-binding protein [Alphaproteobacteria bacterium]
MVGDRDFDFIIVGSGAASIIAALVAQEAGAKPLILEKTDKVGGSTAMSGGVAWMPVNPLQQAAGVNDNYEMARAYLDACAGDAGPASSPERRHAFLTEAPRVVRYLQDRGMEFVHAEGYSDYHEGQKPGGVARSRSLVGQIYDARRLGKWRGLLRRNAGGPPILMHEASALGHGGRTWASRKAYVRVALRMLRNMLGADLVGNGMAIQGRLLEIALKAGIPIWLNAGVRDFLVEDGRVVGVEADVDGQVRQLKASKGVLINAGGFSHNLAMRQQYQQQPTGTDWTNANPGDTGEMQQAAMALGADVAIMEQCWWVSVSVTPDGKKLIHPFDMSKPYSLLVDTGGERFVNESTSYMEVGIQMYARDKIVPAVPSWLISDSRHRNRYRWSGQPGGKPTQEWVDSGYMIVADTIEELAEKCGIPPAALRGTVDRFNGFAARGVDEDFHRGESAYDRFAGDSTVKPNPNLGAIEQAPFYAVRLFPGDVGTCGGLMTDEFAQVLRKDGSVIPGLYATGNSTASVMGRSYPGAGASIGASMTFGFIAARHATGANV